MRNGRGSRRPKKLPACVMRKRGLGAMLEPGEIVEVAAVRDRDHVRARPQRPRLLRDRLRRRHDCVRAAGHEPGHGTAHALLRLQRGRVGAAVRMRKEGVTQVGHPARACEALHGGPDEMDGAGRGRRQHDIDSLTANDSGGGRDRRQRPADVLVGDEQPAAEEARLETEAIEAGCAMQLLGRAAALGADVPRTVDPRLCRRLQLVVAVHPFRVVRCEHVCLDAQLGQMGRKLQRPLDTAASRRREVERDDEHLHRR